MTFSRKIIGWYKREHRVLPWRETKDPYCIWLSEIILQQTRVEQGLGYYDRFVKKFPDVFTLAKADEQEVLKTWQGLGYYSRACNLLVTAKIIVKKFKGVFPGNYSEIISLKGIGPYTAAAIMSIAFNKPYPVVDGNVLRVISRFLAIDKPIKDLATTKEINIFLESVIDKKQPGNFNQAMMELGALICKPKNPDCGSCPLAFGCKAFKKGKTNMFPVKGHKTVVLPRYLYYLVIHSEFRNKPYIYINKRSDNDIWKNLYDFPWIEVQKPKTLKQLQCLADWKKLFINDQPEILSFGTLITHKLSHRELFVRFIEMEIKTQLSLNSGLIRILPSEIKQYPVPRLIEKYLEGSDLRDQ
jgi:A/G-specific adenine glycosylase